MPGVVPHDAEAVVDDGGHSMGIGVILSHNGEHFEAL